MSGMQEKDENDKSRVGVSILLSSFLNVERKKRGLKSIRPRFRKNKRQNRRFKTLSLLDLVSMQSLRYTKYRFERRLNGWRQEEQQNEGQSTVVCGTRARGK